MGCGVFPKLTVIPDPLTPEERYQLGQTYEAQGKMDLAEREYQAARPYSKAYLALGNLYFSRQDPESRQKAALNYQKALTQGPAPAAANNLAWLYLQEGRLLGPAETLAVRAILEGVAAKLPAAEIDTFKDTLYEIRKAKRAGKEGL
jgi:TPR repeat protein